MKNRCENEILAKNIEHYQTDDALEQYSHYHLMYEEKYLLPKYFKKQSSVLDLACGAGRTTVRLHEMGYTVKGVDLSQILLNAAKSRFPYIPFEQGSYCDLHEADNSFDNILISYNGLDYVLENEREQALRECSRVLKQGGCLIFSSHNIKYLHGVLSPINHHKWFCLKNTLNAFLDNKVLYEPHTGLWTFYASQEYIKNQTEKYSFVLKEVIGCRPFGRLGKIVNREILERYLSPWLNYVFQKI
jgi:ubiquinone/menaquinone biosynthesis C-methylase UbiE